MNHFPVHFVVWDHKKDFIFLWDSWQPEQCVLFASAEHPRASLAQEQFHISFQLRDFPHHECRAQQMLNTLARDAEFSWENYLLIQFPDFPVRVMAETTSILCFWTSGQGLSPSFHWVSNLSRVEFLTSQISPYPCPPAPPWLGCGVMPLPLGPAPLSHHLTCMLSLLVLEHSHRFFFIMIIFHNI